MFIHGELKEPKSAVRPERWRRQAVAAEARAAEMPEDWRRRAMLRIAAAYDELAKQAEKRAQIPAAAL
jgi:hypothetical protein